MIDSSKMGALLDTTEIANQKDLRSLMDFIAISSAALGQSHHYRLINYYWHHLDHALTTAVVI